MRALSRLQDSAVRRAGYLEELGGVGVRINGSDLEHISGALRRLSVRRRLLTPSPPPPSFSSFQE